MHAVQDPLRGATVIHVADLEGDALELLADLLLHQMSFVIRAKNDRGLVAGREATDLKLFAAVTATPVVITTTVEFRRNQRTKKSDAPHSSSKPNRGRERSKAITWAVTREASLEVRVRCARCARGSTVAMAPTRTLPAKVFPSTSSKAFASRAASTPQPAQRPQGCRRRCDQ